LPKIKMGAKKDLLLLLIAAGLFTVQPVKLMN